MSHDWPVPRAAPRATPEDAAPLLPLALHEHVELILASAAIRAFAERRAEQMLTHGHTPEADLERDVDEIVRMARYRLDGFIERIGRGRRNAPHELREILLRKLDLAGGMLIAARERLLTEVPEE